MTCPACNYSMDSFDQECPRCHGKGLAVKQPQSPHPHQNPSAPPTQAAPTQYAPTQQGYPQGYPPQPGYPQGYPQHPPAAPSTNSGVPTALIVVLGVVGGIFLLPFLFVMLIGGMTMAGKNISNQTTEQALQSLTIRTTGATITDRGSEYYKRNTITVTGSAKNTSQVQTTVQLEARIYNSSNILVASGTGYETIPPGEEKLFTIQVYDDTQTEPFTYKVVKNE